MTSSYRTTVNRLQRRRQLTDIMPELEPLPKSRRRVQSNVAKILHRDPNDLEPAFVNECDYPPGWLVYHPALGVVLKKKADLYQPDLIELMKETTTIISESKNDTSESSSNNNSMPTDTEGIHLNGFEKTESVQKIPNGLEYTVVPSMEGTDVRVSVPALRTIPLVANGG
jgi:hypothetical protein